MRVYLTGFMGAGKSSVGRLLAERLAATFVDLDREIERSSGISVPRIFAERGEAEFRLLEREALRRTDVHPRAVIATGGGVVESPDNRAWMRARGLRLWLEPSFETLLERLEGGEGRPLFGGATAARELYERRLPAYADCELRVSVADGETVPETVEGILEALEERKCAT